MAVEQEQGRIHTFFSHVSTWVAKWTGSHWAVFIAGLFVVIGLSSFGIEITNIAISIVTLMMVFILQNTQNRDSAALHLKLDEMVKAEQSSRRGSRCGVEIGRGNPRTPSIVFQGRASEDMRKQT